MMNIKNPVLKGFNPDPSMIYVNGVFYIATSTFEWFPGVNIYATENLQTFSLIARPLCDTKKINLRGIPSSGGVWAPCLSYNRRNKRFYLVYSNQHTWAEHPFKDCNNYVISADRIDRKWSDPVYINSSGFDASLFHDDDGKSYYMNMEWNHNKTDREQFSGILLSEFDIEKNRIIGKTKKIFTGTELGRVEGPHIYKRNGWYYLITAEGGTGYEHAVTAARSRNIFGEYEVHPDKQILTSYQTKNVFQKRGHASICEDNNGGWYIAYLCSRPLKNGRCPLGRETAVSELIWKDDWMYVLDNVKEETAAGLKTHYNFDGSLEFLNDFQTLRLSFDKSRFSVKNGKITLTGKDSILSAIEQTILCRRQTDFCFESTVEMEFAPESFQHMAGLIYRYDEKNQYYLYSYYDEETACVMLSVMSFNRGRYDALDESKRIKAKTKIWLRLNVARESGQFSYSFDGISFEKIGAEFDASILSDDYVLPMGFTGAFTGVACQDLSGHKKQAVFSNFIYESKNDE